MIGISVPHLYKTLLKLVLQIAEDYQYITFCCDAENKQSTEHVKHIHLENAFLFILCGYLDLLSVSSLIKIITLSLGFMFLLHEIYHL